MQVLVPNSIDPENNNSRADFLIAELAKKADDADVGSTENPRVYSIPQLNTSCLFKRFDASDSDDELTVDQKPIADQLITYPRNT